MQKKLIALAIAGLVAAPAFAATSNVDVYGQLTLSVDRMDTDTSIAGQDDTMTQVASYASRIGFKGSEDLGGGLAGIWQIENQLNADNGNGNIASNGGAVLGGGNFSASLRNTFVGLKSNTFGTALIGKHDTPYKLSTGRLDPFADTAGDYNIIVGNVDGSNNFDLRPGNVIAYISPTFSGLHGAIAYVAGNETGNGVADDESAWSVMGMYDNGPIFGTVAYEKHNIEGAAGDDREAWKVGGGYNFGNATLGLIYEKAETILGGKAEDRGAWYIPATYTMGNIVLKAAYGQADETRSDNNGADFYALGADYNLSKRTKAFLVYANTDNDNGGNYGAAVAGTNAYVPGTGYAGGTTGAAGNSPSVLSLGVRHAF
jgi:predicted porin